MEEKKKKQELNFRQGELSGLEKQMQALAEELMKSMSENENFSDSGKPMKLGFSIKVNKDGKPQVREVKEVRKEHFSAGRSGRRSPLVNVEYFEKEIVVTSEYLGAEKENFELSSEKNLLNISLKTRNNKFSRIIQLREAVEPGKIKWVFNNGVLEATLQKAKN